MKTTRMMTLRATLWCCFWSASITSTFFVVLFTGANPVVFGCMAGAATGFLAHHISEARKVVHEL